MEKTQETCRCAVADCALHQSACEMLDILKEIEEEPDSPHWHTFYERIRAVIKQAAKAEGR